MSQLVKIIDAGKKYLKDKIFNIEINHGDFILLNGQNGTGKSTLLKLLIDYIKPDFGKIVRSNKIKISFLPEIPSIPLHMNTLEYFTTIDNVKDKKLNWDLIEKLEIPVKKSIRQLSKGNKQMVSLLSTLAGKNDLVVLDEPLNGIDQSRIKNIKDEINRLHKCGVTFIVSSHLEKHFKSLATKVINL